MAKNGRLTLTCSLCNATFTLRADAYARRCERYPGQVLCQRCIGERWLQGRGRYMAERLAQDDATPTAQPIGE